MASIKVANFAFIQSGMFTLPGLTYSQPGGEAHIRTKETMHFDLPNDSRKNGILSFYWDTGKGADVGIDVAWEVTVNGGSKYAWSFTGDRTGCFVLPVFSLNHGDNYVIFHVTKGGKVTVPDPDESAGGKGVVHFGQVCIYFHRDVAV